MELKLSLVLSRCKLGLPRTYCLNRLLEVTHYVSFSSSTDAFIENLAFEEGSKRERSLFHYVQNVENSWFGVSTIGDSSLRSQILNQCTKMNNIQDRITNIESLIKSDQDCRIIIPNNKLYCLLVSFAKIGDTIGVQAVQCVVEKYNPSHFASHSEYKHYLAEALWISGNVEDSLKLFSFAYNNVRIRPKVLVMMKCLFPLLLSHHSEITLNKTVLWVEQFALKKKDYIILAYLWKELFQSSWFSDQQLSKKILERNPHLLKLIQWMTATMGREFLEKRKIEDFYRLIEFTMENQFQEHAGTLIRLLFDYYYIHQNIERCSAVIKYASSFNYPLSEDQQRRYINLLLKSKDAITCKQNIKKPQNLKYKF